MSLVTAGLAKTDQCCQADDIKIGQQTLYPPILRKIFMFFLPTPVLQWSGLGSATDLAVDKCLGYL